MAAKRPKTFLVAEDEDHLRKMIVAEYTDLGHCVLEARSGRHAVELLAKHAVDVLITDLLMPDGGGEAVLDEAFSKKRRPKVYVITGDVDADLNKLLSRGVTQIFLKPFKLHEMLEEITSDLAPAKKRKAA